MIINPFHDLIGQESQISHIQNPALEVLLKQLGYKHMPLQSHDTVLYILDYRQKKFLYIEPSCKYVLGYDADYLMQRGPKFYTGLWNKNDFKVFNEKVYPSTMKFLKLQPISYYPDFSSSFNYRLFTKEGKWITVLQKSAYFMSANRSMPLTAIGFIIDISHYKEDSKIIHVIEGNIPVAGGTKQETLLKSVYYPDNMSGLLSRRELEVLQYIYKGLSSKLIAGTLGISLNTINNHRKSMIAKTHTKNTSELLHYASQNGLI